MANGRSFGVRLVFKKCSEPTLKTKVNIKLGQYVIYLLSQYGIWIWITGPFNNRATEDAVVVYTEPL